MRTGVASVKVRPTVLLLAELIVDAPPVVKLTVSAWVTRGMNTTRAAAKQKERVSS